jgi:hypothetical protein
MFKDVDKEFERIDKRLGSDFLKMPRISFRVPGMSGISVTIRSGTGMKPKVDVKTFGQYKNFEPQLRKKLGIEIPTTVEPVRRERIESERIKMPKVTEEPEAEIKDLAIKQIIKIKLPDIKNADDIEVKKLEQSIEVKAVAGDKAYFKLIPTKGKMIESKRFEDGMLTLEIRK